MAWFRQHRPQKIAHVKKCRKRLTAGLEGKERWPAAGKASVQWGCCREGRGQQEENAGKGEGGD